MSTHKPYLVQRIEVRKHGAEGRKGVDKHFDFDYMGSSEFEFGALPKALKAMRAAKDATWSPTKIKHDGHVVWYVGPESLCQVARELFVGQLEDPYKARLKERTSIQNRYGINKFPREAYYENLVGWWDILSTYALFTEKKYARQWLSSL